MWNIIGNERAVSFLGRSVARNTLAHAYLIAGAPHTGKMTLALRLAQAVNCGASEPPCLECASCRRIATGVHTDVLALRLESDPGSEDTKAKTEISTAYIKDLQQQASLPPFEGRRKVFIIDGAEMLSLEAANRLLKTLEEPPPHVLFILLTADEASVPATVVSRCQHVDLAPVAASEIEAALTARGVEGGKARLLARLSRGCPGWAFSALQDGTLLTRRAERLEELFEVIEGDYETRFGVAERLASGFSRDRAGVYDTLDLWLGWWRDLLLVKTGAAGAVTNIDYEASLSTQAQALSLDQITSAIRELGEAGARLRLNGNARLVLEVLMLHIPRKEERGGAQLAAQFANG